MTPRYKLLWVLHCPASHNKTSQQSNPNRGLYQPADKTEDAASQLQIPTFVSFAACVEIVCGCRDCMGISLSRSIRSPMLTLLWQTLLSCCLWYSSCICLCTRDSNPVVFASAMSGAMCLCCVMVSCFARRGCSWLKWQM